MTLIVIPRPSKRAFERLERTAGKLARYVLRGEDDGNIIFLPDCYPDSKKPCPKIRRSGIEAQGGLEIGLATLYYSS